jgi:hypothetical protein
MKAKAYKDMKNAAPVNPDAVYTHESGFKSAADYKAYKNGGAK